MHPPSRRLWTCALAGTACCSAGCGPRPLLRRRHHRRRLPSPAAALPISPRPETWDRWRGRAPSISTSCSAVPDQSAVLAKIQAVSTPGGARFRRFLTPMQFQATYSPSTQALDAVEGWTDRVHQPVAVPQHRHLCHRRCTTDTRKPGDGQDQPGQAGEAEPRPQVCAADDRCPHHHPHGPGLRRHDWCGYAHGMYFLQAMKY